MFNLTVKHVFALLKVFAMFPSCCIPARQAAETARVPIDYGIGICKALARKRILRTRKGPGGGNYLPECNLNTTLADVLEAYDVADWDVPEMGTSTDELREIYSAFKNWAEKATIGSLVDNKVFNHA